MSVDLLGLDRTIPTNARVFGLFRARVAVKGCGAAEMRVVRESGILQ